MSRTTLARRLFGAGASMVAGLALVVTGAGPAEAAPPAECVGTQHGTYDPPLTATPQPTHVQIEETFSCPVGDFASARVSKDFGLQTTGCLLPGNPFPDAGTFVYEWDGGEAHSEITYTTTTVIRPPGQTIVTSLGTVTGGHYEGSTAVRLVALVTPSVLDCLSGIHTLSGPSELTIT